MRRILFLISLLAYAVTSAIGSAGSARDTKAVAYQINPHHSGTTEFESGFSPPLRLLWSQNLYGRPSYPLIADGLVFHTATNENTALSTIYALDALSGAIRWQAAVSDTRGSTAAYDRGQVFVVDFVGTLTAFKAVSGRIHWQVRLPDVNIAAPPVAQDGLVFVWGDGVGGTVFAVDETSGDIRWTRSVDVSSAGSPVLGDGGVYFTNPCHTYKLAPMDGALLWDAQNNCQNSGVTPVYAGHALYVRGFSNVILSSKTGQPEGTFVSFRSPSIFVDGNGIRIAVALTNAGVLQAFDPLTGAPRWTFQARQKLVSAPLVVNGLVVEGSTRHLFLVDGRSGALVWSTKLPGHIPYPDEINGTQPLTGLGAGENILIIPGRRHTFAFGSGYR